MTVLLLGLFGCTSTAEPGDGERAPIGKADLVGQCLVSDCDGQSADGDCWCDESCIDFGDCCANAFDVCELPTPDCNDGTTPDPLCDQVPSCEPGQVAAVLHSCFSCVDVLTCEPAAADCADGSDLSQFCDVPPLCDDGFDKFIVGGCFQCLDPATCQPPA